MLNENDLLPVNSSPKNKSSSGLLSGLWSKRSTKVEPHPLSDGELSDSCVNYGNYNNIQQPKSKPDTSFAKCSPKSISKSQSLVNNTENYYHKLPKNSNNINKNNNNNNNNDVKGSNNNNNNNNLVSKKENIKNISSNNETLYNSDTRPTVNLRVKSSNKSTNISNLHNRLSHQFILCCKAGDQKQLSPAVSVRYNSIPDVLNEQTKTALREHMVLDLNGITSDGRAPLAQVTETNSAPETPINPQKSDSFNSQSSPSTQSIQSAQSINDGQPRAIAITACRSRLRLKLLPPGKPIVNEAYLTKSLKEDNSLNSKNINGIDDDNISERTVLAEQHLSSPDISASNNEFPNKDCQQNRSMSFDRIQNFQTFQKSSNSGSTDLARQALMAAQVLNLIPTEKARERNFLANRLASCSLLGASELTRVLPHKEITIFVGTWNMNGQSPPKQMNDFVLPASMEHVPDLIVIGTQESCPERFEWEVTLQETLGPSHVLFHAANLGTLHLAVFIRRDLIWFCSVPEEANLSVRPGTAFRTKGAVAISFCLFGTSMLFVTSHLTAHQQKVKERVQDVKRIIHALDLPRNLKIRHKNKDVTQNFDSVFWCGDLNFRLGEPREKLLKWIETTKFPLPSHLPHGYMHTDQLKSVLSDGAAFKGFMEANITFPPTYKFDPGTQQFDTSSKQRAPAYTDRILYKYRQPSLALRRSSVVPERFLSASSHTEPSLSCIAYDSVPSITTSDHKPVWALFRNTIKPGIDSIPLAAGLFLRDVYVEGMRRRLNHSYTGSSAVCSIQ